MCDQETTLLLRTAPEIDCGGRAGVKEIQVDACVADLIHALETAGIHMLGSCCGHQRREGHIHLADGRALLVLSQEQTDQYFTDLIPLLGE